MVGPTCGALLRYASYELRLEDMRDRYAQVENDRRSEHAAAVAAAAVMEVETRVRDG